MTEPSRAVGAGAAGSPHARRLSRGWLPACPRSASSPLAGTSLNGATRAIGECCAAKPAQARHAQLDLIVCYHHGKHGHVHAPPFLALSQWQCCRRTLLMVWPCCFAHLLRLSASNIPALGVQQQTESCQHNLYLARRTQGKLPLHVHQSKSLSKILTRSAAGAGNTKAQQPLCSSATGAVRSPRTRICMIM